MELNIANVGLLCTLLCTLVGFLTYMATNKKEATKEIKDDTSTQTSLKMQLEYISRGVDDIKLEMRDIKSDAKCQDEKINSLMQQVARLEESEKSLHKRQNEFDTRLNEFERKQIKC